MYTTTNIYHFPLLLFSDTSRYDNEFVNFDHSWCFNTIIMSITKDSSHHLSMLNNMLTRIYL